MKYTTGSFFHKDLVEGSKGHYRVWGIIPVDKQGRHGYPIRNKECVFNSRKEAKDFIENQGLVFAN